MKVTKLKVKIDDLKVGDLVISDNNEGCYFIVKVKRHCDCHNCPTIKYVRVIYTGNRWAEPLWSREEFTGKDRIVYRWQ